MTETTSVLVVKCFRPNMPLSCWKQIRVAVPPMKPVIVECDKKSTRIPSLHFHISYQSKPNNSLMKITNQPQKKQNIYLKRPMSVWKIPVKKVVVKTKLRYNVGSSTADTFSPIVWPMINEQAATVPTARCFEFPNTA